MHVKEKHYLDFEALSNTEKSFIVQYDKFVSKTQSYERKFKYTIAIYLDMKFTYLPICQKKANSILYNVKL